MMRNVTPKLSPERKMFSVVVVTVSEPGCLRSVCTETLPENKKWSQETGIRQKGVNIRILEM